MIKTAEKWASAAIDEWRRPSSVDLQQVILKAIRMAEAAARAEERAACAQILEALVEDKSTAVAEAMRAAADVLRARGEPE